MCGHRSNECYYRILGETVTTGLWQCCLVFEMQGHNNVECHDMLGLYNDEKADYTGLNDKVYDDCSFWVIIIMRNWENMSFHFGVCLTAWRSTRCNSNHFEKIDRVNNTD